jgi:hypothetical protein
LGSKAGSIEPYLSHLFKGGLLFESILKGLYPNYKNETLNKIFKNIDFQTDFGIKSVETRSTSLENIIFKINSDDLQTSFNTISRLRNTTGHNLVWDNVFNESNYEKLFNQQMNAILYVISKKYIQNNTNIV